MGAVTFSLDPRLLRVLNDVEPFDILVETGTFQGDTVEFARAIVPEVVTIELDPALAASAASRFHDFANVRVLAGTSPSRLAELVDGLQERSVVYWLDAHWCAPLEAPGDDTPAGQCPLVEELQAVGHLNEHSVVLIDDARLFLAPPPPSHALRDWPTFAEVVRTLGELSTRHELAVVNDVIAFFPKRYAGAVRDFGIRLGVDWLSVLDRARDYDTLLADNIAKEAVIHELSQALKSLAVAGRRDALSSDQRSLTLLNPVRVLRRAKRAAGRRLVYPMTLQQYPPRPMTPVRSARPSNRLVGDLPTISIVMPSYNQAAYIETAIRSVVGQQYPALEFFIQDGGSTDDSARVLSVYRDRLDGVSIEPDRGQADALNRGFARTTGQVMGWLNSDDLLLPGSLHAIGAFFAAHPEVDVVYGHRLVIDEADLEVGRWMLPSDTHAYLDWADFVPQETLYWRRSLWDRVGGEIDATKSFALDWELLLRFADAGARFARLPRFLGAFRVHESSKTVNEIGNTGAQEMAAIRSRRSGRNVPQREIDRNLRRLYASAWAERMRSPLLKNP